MVLNLSTQISLLILICAPAINDFFTSWFNALGYATAQAQLIASPVVNELDPPVAVWFMLRDIFFALALGLAYIAGPEAAGITGLLAATATSGKALLKGMQQAPTMGRGIWPAGTESSKSIQIGDVDQELNNATSQLSKIINAGLEVLMRDVPSFVAFAETGYFSGSQTLSLPKETEGLDMGLRTFILSTVMNANGWHAHANVNVTRDQVAKMNMDCKWNGDMCGDIIWYSDATQRSYAITQNGGALSTTQLLKDIGENSWSTLPLLFDGAYSCTIAGNMGKTPSFIHSDGTIDMSCMSQFKLCIGCGADCPVALIDGKCPFPPCVTRADGNCY